MKPLGLCHIGLGPLGRGVLADAIARGLGPVVAAVDPAHAGRELVELVPTAPAGLVVAASVEELAQVPFGRALVTTQSDLELCMETFRPLLARGVDVVSSCEELLWPWLRHPILAQELHQRCVRGRGRLIGTGVNPGFVMDFLPAVLSGATHRVERAEIARVQDATTRRLPFQKKIGAGLSPAAFEAAAAAGTLRHVGLGESLALVAHALGLEVERWDESLEPVLAERPLECGLGPIPVGHAAGVKQVARGLRGEQLLVRLEFVAAIGQAQPRDEVRLIGDPPLHLILEGGVHGDRATSAVLCNVLVALARIEPGLATMLDLPPATLGSARRT